MLIIDFYLYIFVLISWLIYILNSLYQNHKMKYFLPNKKIEILTIPFYVFYLVSFYTLIEKLIKSTAISSEIGDSNFNSFWPIVSASIGLFFCFFSILLYTYISLFVKSFPSCIALRSGQHLKGIYNYIRHPSYYIFLFITFGSALCLQSKWLFILACINHISLYFYYMIEEGQIRKNNPYYNEYLKNTKRFFPRFSKLDS